MAIRLYSIASRAEYLSKVTGHSHKAKYTKPMGFIGGEPAYRFLKRRYPDGKNLPVPDGNPFQERGISKLGTYFGEEIFEELRGKTVVDFGCGPGDNAIEIALNSRADVIGLDIQEHFLEKGRAQAARLGVSDRVRFVSSCDRPADVIISTDAFEHFDDPAFILREMRRLLKDDGYVLVEFGYTWYHPLGGHTFSVFPWAHLLFTEESLLRWRRDFKPDGATRFHEVAGGLNQMTISRWEQLIRESDFEFATYSLVPIGAVRRLHNRLTREFFTSRICARLLPKRAYADGDQTVRFAALNAD
jgi:SAM-dependent methyltransferase